MAQRTEMSTPPPILLQGAYGTLNYSQMLKYGSGCVPRTSPGAVTRRRSWRRSRSMRVDDELITCRRRRFDLSSSSRRLSIDVEMSLTPLAPSSPPVSRYISGASTSARRRPSTRYFTEARRGTARHSGSNLLRRKDDDVKTPSSWRASSSSGNVYLVI